MTTEKDLSDIAVMFSPVLPHEKVVTNNTDNSEDEIVLKSTSLSPFKAPSLVAEVIIEEEIGEVILPLGDPQPKPIEEVKKQNSALKSSMIGDEPEELPTLDLDWSMFEKGTKLGEGANGTVFKVKALKTSIFSSEHGGRIELNNAELLKRYGST